MSKSVEASKRRVALSNILARLSQPGETILTAHERASLADLLTQIWNGHDVRKYLGIKPMRARAPVFDKKEQIAIHYWALRDHPPHEKHDVAWRRVAKVWGCDENRIYKYAVRYKAHARFLASLGTLENLLEMARFYANTHLLTALARLKESLALLRKRAARFADRLQSASTREPTDDEVTAFEAEESELYELLALIESEIGAREASLEAAAPTAGVFRQAVNNLLAEVDAIRTNLNAL